MNLRGPIALALGALGASALAGGAFAGPPPRQSVDLALPQVSPRAGVSQRIGVTDLEIWYHRPAVGERPIWGSLVPYGEVWRAGANENTVFTASTDIEVEGQPLPAGSYGLHAIPGETEWEIIFSRDHGAWGSFSYDVANDALRMKVRPEEAPFVERLAYTIDDPTETGATVSLRWEKLRVPFTVEADTKALTLASIKDQLKGQAQFSWLGLNQAAQWCLQNELNYEEALTWAEQSIEVEERFDNLAAKSQLLERTGKAAEAEPLMARALEIGADADVHNYARQLLGNGELDRAMEVFRLNAERHPESWVVAVGLARGHSALGDFSSAAASMREAIEKAPETQTVYLQGLLGRLEKSEDINK